ncbi:homeodomain-like superfamily protein [Actinidia rufa]|uniref:Homeodomain-like superfamily protein n=1 Tax=Actinidia rufa TaxID=165716 RepID=A0A7J0GA13_9ERIC|nr:homeodomain-like superfamily protein [Actinidia rufa]
MYPGLISPPPFLSHPNHYHQAALVQHEGMFISPLLPCHQPHHLLQGLIQLPINPLCHPHHVPIPEELSHPLISMTSDVQPHLRWTPELHACFVDAANQLGGPFSQSPVYVLIIF